MTTPFSYISTFLYASSILTFDYVNKIPLKFSESPWAVLSSSTVHYAVQGGSSHFLSTGAWDYSVHGSAVYTFQADCFDLMIWSPYSSIQWSDARWDGDLYTSFSFLPDSVQLRKEMNEPLKRQCHFENVWLRVNWSVALFAPVKSRPLLEEDRADLRSTPEGNAPASKLKMISKMSGFDNWLAKCLSFCLLLSAKK